MAGTWFIKNNTPWACKVRVFGKNNHQDTILQPNQVVQQQFANTGKKCIVAYNWGNNGNNNQPMVCCIPIDVSNQNKWCGLHMHWNGNDWMCDNEPPQEDPCQHPCSGASNEGIIDAGGVVN